MAIEAYILIHSKEKGGLLRTSGNCGLPRIVYHHTYIEYSIS